MAREQDLSGAGWGAMSDARTDGRSAQGQPSRLTALLFGAQMAGARPGTALYMLLDAARDPRIYGWLSELGEAVQQRSLYPGDVGASLRRGSPNTPGLA